MDAFGQPWKKNEAFSLMYQGPVLDYLSNTRQCPSGRCRGKHWSNERQ